MTAAQQQVTCSHCACTWTRLKLARSYADTFHVTSDVDIEVVRVHELPDELRMQLRRLTRAGTGHSGLMAEDFDYALACERIHPNSQALAIIARLQDGEISGWAFVHATGRRERTRRYARKFHYVNIHWKCYLYVAKRHRRCGIGSKLLAAASAAHTLQEGAPWSRNAEQLNVRPWNRGSALFFERAANEAPGTFWHSWEAPHRFIKRRA